MMVAHKFFPTLLVGKVLYGNQILILGGTTAFRALSTVSSNKFKPVQRLITMKTKLLLGMMTALLVLTTSVVARSLVGEEVSTRPPTAVFAQIRGSDQGGVAVNKTGITQAVLQDNQPVSPQAPVKVDEIAIDGPYAIAIVLFGEHGGGMAALKKNQGVWKVVGGGGGAFDSKYLVEIGFPPETARTLMQRIQ